MISFIVYLSIAFRSITEFMLSDVVVVVCYAGVAIAKCLRPVPRLAMALTLKRRLLQPATATQRLLAASVVAAGDRSAQGSQSSELEVVEMLLIGIDVVVCQQL